MDRQRRDWSNGKLQFLLFSSSDRCVHSESQRSQFTGQFDCLFVFSVFVFNFTFSTIEAIKKFEILHTFQCVLLHIAFLIHIYSFMDVYMRDDMVGSNNQVAQLLRKFTALVVNRFLSSCVSHWPF